MPSCGSFPEFLPLVQAVTAACCTTGVECPPGGIPTTCTAECAAVLLPMQVRTNLSSFGLTSEACSSCASPLAVWLAEKR